MRPSDNGARCSPHDLTRSEVHDFKAWHHLSRVTYGPAGTSKLDISTRMLRTTALGIARVGEGQAGTPTPEPVAPKASGITGTDAGTAVAELPPLVTDLAAYGSQQVQDRPGGANRGKIADNAAPVGAN